MSVLAQSAHRHYPIADAWLDRFQNDANRYVDLKEIQNGDSQYVRDMRLNAVEEAQRAMFFITGVHVGHAGKIWGMMTDETYSDEWPFAGGLTHPDRFGRVYAKGTTARKVKIVGMGNTYGNF